MFTCTGIHAGSHAGILAGLFTFYLSLVVRFTFPQVRTSAGEMLVAFADAAVHRFDAISGGVAKAIAIKANNVRALSSLVIWPVAFPTCRGLAIMI